jgi:hypothetical protein
VIIGAQAPEQVTMKPKLVAPVVVCFALLIAADAHALEESTRRPFYVQGTLGSYSFWAGFDFGDQVFWHPDFEFGYHFSGRHDGVVLGIRQGFNIGRDPYDIGETSLRGGYDFAFPLRNGRFEITIGPYGTFGLDYFFRGANAGIRAAVGVEGKFFFVENVYLLVRPIELSIGEFVNLGFLMKNVYFNLNAGLGAGFAF